MRVFVSFVFVVFSFLWLGGGGGGGGLLYVPATCKCISGMDLLKQVDVMPLCGRSWGSNLQSHPHLTLCPFARLFRSVMVIESDLYTNGMSMITLE